MTPKFLLVTSPIVGEFRSISVLGKQARQTLGRPSLGTLVVASLLRSLGVDTEVFDLDRYWVREVMDLSVEERLERTADQLTRRRCRWIGLSTICSSYHLTLRLAQKLKLRQPEVRIVLGGPQASATAAVTLAQCPQVDFVLRGEVEETLGLFVRESETHPERVPGLAYRQGTEVIERPVPPPPPPSLFPTPAYDLWAEGPIPVLPLEAGRGCPFGCRFCSTSPYFGRSFRTREASVLLAECEELAQRYQSTEVCLINDHIAVNKEFLHCLCEGWRRSPVLSQLSFSCSLRPDSATPEVIELLASSGCTKAFLGVETGSQRLQEVVGKNLKVEGVVPLVDQFRRLGIQLSVSFIAGFPEETTEDLAQTLSMIEQLLPRSNTLPMLNVLSPLTGSGYVFDFANRLEFDPEFSAQIMHNLAMDPVGAIFIKEHPVLCSADYAFPLEHLDRAEVVHLARFHRYIGNRLRFPALAAAKVVGGTYRLFRMWHQHLKRLGQTAVGEEYYASKRFVSEFLAFLQSLDAPAEASDWDGLLRGVLEMQSKVNAASDSLGQEVDSEPLVVTQHSWLRPAPHLACSPISPSLLAESLCDGRLDPALFQATWLRVSSVELGRQDPNGNALSEWELEVHEPGPLVQELLTRCATGIRLDTLIQGLERHPASEAIPNTARSWLFAIQKMLEEGLLEVVPH